MMARLMAIVALATALSGWCAQGDDARAPSLPDVGEIAAMLPEKPGLPGATVADRAAWERVAALGEAKKTVAAAERLLTGPAPELTEEMYFAYSKTGRRGAYLVPFKARLAAVETLTLAECMENRGRFIPKLAEYLDAIADERSWVFPFHDKGCGVWTGKRRYIDLGTGARAGELAYALCWLGEKLPPSTVARMKAAMEEKVFRPYLDYADGKIRENWFWFRGGNNWNSVCHNGVMTAALGLIGDRTLRARFVRIELEALKVYYDNFGDDGYTSEGPGYWNYGFGSQMLLAATLCEHTGGRLDILVGKGVPYRAEKFRNVAAYPFAIQVEPRFTPAFSDSHGGAGATVRAAAYYALMNLWWPDLVPVECVPEPSLEAGAQSTLMRVAHTCFGKAAFRPGCREKVPPAPDVCTWFPSSQVMLSRSARGERPFAIAVKGGHNGEMHNHNDIGSYEIVLDATEMTCDPGAPAYNALYWGPHKYQKVPTCMSVGHSVPEIDGVLQSRGKEFAGKVVSTAFGEDEDVLKLELLGAYPGFGPGESCVRTVRHSRRENVITVEDAFRFAKPRRIVDAVMSRQRLVRGDGKGVCRLVAGKEGPSVSMAVEVTGSGWRLEEETLVEADRSDMPNRIKVVLDHPVAEATVRIAYRPLPASRAWNIVNAPE